jgi:hypothetical protein
MYDEHGDPTDATAIDWAEHNDHADGAADLDDQERDVTDLPQSGRVWRPVTAVACSTCGAPIGEQCHPVEQRATELVHWEWLTVAPHPSRFHAAGRRCADQCDACPAEPDDWTTPDINGITARLDGADEALIVLWESGSTSVETIRTVCETLDREIGYGNVYEGIAVVYLRYRNRLVPVDLRYGDHGDTITVDVIHQIAARIVIVAQGSYPAPVDWSSIRPTDQHDRYQG